MWGKVGEGEGAHLSDDRWGLGAVNTWHGVQTMCCELVRLKSV